MANGAAFDDAIEIARAHPALGVGCHIVLNDGIPVAPPESIPTLLGSDGKSFRPTLGAIARAILLGKIDEKEVAREAIAQIDRLKRAGVQPTHIDTHKHTHLFPLIARPLLQAAELCGVRAVRCPFEPKWSFALGHGSGSRRLAIRLLGGLRSRFESTLQAHKERIRSTDGTVGISTTGQFYAATLAEILGALPAEGTYEICCHPGYNDSDLDRVTTRLRDQRNIEREALLSLVPRTLVLTNAPSLVSYASIVPVTALATAATSVRF